VVREKTPEELLTIGWTEYLLTLVIERLKIISAQTEQGVAAPGSN